MEVKILIPVFCQKCGTVYREPVSFCNKCGSKLLFRAVASIPPKPPKPASVENSRNGCLATAIIITVAVAIIVGGIYLIIRFIRWAWDTPMPDLS